MTDPPTLDRLRQYASDPLAFLSDLIIPGADGPAKFSDIWADFQVEMFERIAPCLLAVARQQKPPLRGLWLERTKGTSKDSDVGACLLWLLCFSPRPLLCELGADKKEQATETRKAMQDIVRLNPWIKRRRIRFLRERIVCDQTGAICEFIATHETSGHGSRPDVTVCNELSHVGKEDFMSTMADNAGKIPWNFMVIATNAGTRRTWQWRWRELYRTRAQRWWFQKVSCPAPWIPLEELEEAKGRNSTTRYMRLWEGEWGTGEGDALDYDDILASVRKAGPMDPNETIGAEVMWWFVLGIDLGVRHDHAALVVLGGQFGRERIRLARCQSWAPGPDGKVDLLAFKAAVVKAHQDFALWACDFDPNQMEYMAQEIEAETGLCMNPIPFTGPNCDKMARDLLTSFRGRIIDLYEDEKLMNDLHRLSIVERAMKYKLTAVSDEEGHADRAIAFAIVLPQALMLSQMDPPEDEGAAGPPVRITT